MDNANYPLSYDSRQSEEKSFEPCEIATQPGLAPDFCIRCLLLGAANLLAHTHTPTPKPVPHTHAITIPSSPAEFDPDPPPLLSDDSASWVCRLTALVLAGISPDPGPPPLSDAWPGPGYRKFAVGVRRKGSMMEEFEGEWHGVNTVRA